MNSFFFFFRGNLRNRKSAGNHVTKHDMSILRVGNSFTRREVSFPCFFIFFICFYFFFFFLLTSLLLSNLPFYLHPPILTTLPVCSLRKPFVFLLIFCVVFCFCTNHPATPTFDAFSIFVATYSRCLSGREVSR